MGSASLRPIDSQTRSPLLAHPLAPSADSLKQLFQDYSFCSPSLYDYYTQLCDNCNTIRPKVRTIFILFSENYFKASMIF